MEIFTLSGVDMALGFIGDIVGTNTAEAIANTIEYVWNSGKDNDLFVL